MAKKRIWWAQVDPPPEGHLDIPRLLVNGQKALKAKSEETAKEEAGLVRGGSCGAIIDKESYGECPRKAHLRWLGVNSQLDLTTELMTKSGEQNEEIWLAELEASGAVVQRQQGESIFWEHPVYGKGKVSPDVRILDKPGGKVIQALELKQLSSIYSMRNHGPLFKPNTKYVIQTANVGLRVGDDQGTDPVPMALCFSSRVSWHLSVMGEKGWKVKDDFYQWGREIPDTYPQKIEPFHVIYYLGWTDEGELWFWTHGMPDKVVTFLKREHIDNFYTAVALQGEKKRLAARPSGKNLLGESEFKMCNYCPLLDVCEESEHDYDKWLDEATELMEEKNNEILNQLID